MLLGGVVLVMPCGRHRREALKPNPGVSLRYLQGSNRSRSHAFNHGCACWANWTSCPDLKKAEAILLCKGNDIRFRMPKAWSERLPRRKGHTWSEVATGLARAYKYSFYSACVFGQAHAHCDAPLLAMGDG